MKKLQILGGGCSKCRELAERTEAAATALGLEFGMEKVSDLNEIMGVRRHADAGPRGWWNGEGERAGALGGGNRGDAAMSSETWKVNP